MQVLRECDKVEGPGEMAIMAEGERNVFLLFLD